MPVIILTVSFISPNFLDILITLANVCDIHPQYMSLVVLQMQEMEELMIMMFQLYFLNWGGQL